MRFERMGCGQTRKHIPTSGYTTGIEIGGKFFGLDLALEFSFIRKRAHTHTRVGWAQV